MWLVLITIIAVLVVIGRIIGGYLLEHGNLLVLMQSAEPRIIGGSAVGTVLIATPLHVRKQLVGGMIGVIKAAATLPQFI